MFGKALKILICSGFVLIFTVKLFAPVTAVFIGHFSKQVKTSALAADQDKDDDKSSDAKDDLKIKKGSDEALVHLYEFVPLVSVINLLFKQQDALFKQTHFPPVPTPPPNLV